MCLQTNSRHGEVFAKLDLDLGDDMPFSMSVDELTAKGYWLAAGTLAPKLCTVLVGVHPLRQPRKPARRLRIKTGSPGNAR